MQILVMYYSRIGNTQKLAQEIAKGVQEVDLLERPARRLPICNGKVKLSFKPFQIRTVKLEI